jgi:hypothetical protein
MNAKPGLPNSPPPQPASEAAAPAVELAIGELRLTGFEPHGRGELHDLIVHEITAFMDSHLVPWRSDISIERLDLGRIKPGATRGATAKSIAGRICAELQRPEYRGEQVSERLAGRDQATGEADRGMSEMAAFPEPTARRKTNGTPAGSAFARNGDCTGRTKP